MTDLSAGLLDFYIDANILFVFAFVLWLATRGMMGMMGLRKAYPAQLQLINGVFITVVLGQIVVLGMGLLLRSGVLPQGSVFNLSDYVLAAFLNGEIQMKPSQFDAVFGARLRASNEILGLGNQFGSLVVFGFLAGAGVFLARLGVSIYRLRKIIANSYAWRRFGRVHLLLSDRIIVPFSARLLTRRVIVLPSRMLEDSADLRMVISHEFQHLRQGDIEWELGLELLKPLMFWNPAYIILKRHIERLRELACDQNVLVRRGYDMRAYCDCLLRVSAHSLRRSNRFAVAMPSVALVQMDRSLFRGKSSRLLQERVSAMILGRNMTLSRRAFALLLAPLCALTLLTSVAIQNSGDWTQDRLMLSTVVNLERLAIRNQFGVQY